MLYKKGDIYEPGDDSYLLAEQVAKHAAGACLDIGTGTGIQAIAASKRCRVVIAADINPEAVKYAEKTAKKGNIHFFVSDMFSGVNDRREEIQRLIGKETLKFDTIVFNPPYLPDEPLARDVALDGGRKGYELLERFLREVGEYLEENGKVLFVFSSLTNEADVNRVLEEQGFEWKLLATKRIFFEELYVCLATKKKNK